MKTIGLALGGGGAKGLAHVLMFEAFDELGIRPAMLTGTSVGAIAGAMYGAGIPAAEMKDTLHHMSITKGEKISDTLKKKGVFRWLDFIDLGWGSNGLLKVDGFFDMLRETLPVQTFEELEIPLEIVATDFWEREEVVFDSGELLPAINASIALPGIFPAVAIDDRVFIDGGAVNPVPYDLLMDRCDVVVAVNVLGKRMPPEDQVPAITESLFNTFSIMQTSILKQKIENLPPHIYIEPDIVDIQVLEFYKADSVFKQAESAKEELKVKLEAVLSKA
jgi:NTE family protein